MANFLHALVETLDAVYNFEIAHILCFQRAICI